MFMTKGGTEEYLIINLSEDENTLGAMTGITISVSKPGIISKDLADFFGDEIKVGETVLDLLPDQIKVGKNVWNWKRLPSPSDADPLQYFRAEGNTEVLADTSYRNQIIFDKVLSTFKFTK